MTFAMQNADLRPGVITVDGTRRIHGFNSADWLQRQQVRPLHATRYRMHGVHTDSPQLHFIAHVSRKVFVAQLADCMLHHRNAEQRSACCPAMPYKAAQELPGQPGSKAGRLPSAYPSLTSLCIIVIVWVLCAQASTEEGAVVLAYALHSDKTHVGKKKTRAVHPFNVFPLQGGIQLTRKPSSVCRLAFAPVVRPRDLGIPDSLDQRTSKQKEL